MSVAEKFIKRIESHVAIGLGKIEAAEKRGHLTPEDLAYLNDIEGSKLPILAAAYEMAAERDGKRVRSRSDLNPDVLAHKGLHVSNAGDKPALYVYGPIGESHGGISADDFRTELSRFSSQETVDLHVHSPGGSFTEGVAIHSLIRNRAGMVNGFVDGVACSAGSVILMACAEVTMAPASEMMIHFASVQSPGSMTADDLAKALKLVQDTNEKLIGLYAPRWKGSEKELRDALSKETYFNPEEAIDRGLADYVSSSLRVAAYAVVAGTCRTPGFSIAASAGPHKRFNMRKATLTLWQMEADSMRNEISTHSHL